MQEVKSIVDRAYNKAESLLKENAEKLSKVNLVVATCAYTVWLGQASKFERK